ncbi:recombinase family protein [Trueperella pyogenes]|uniref:recombinase family protein n=1 Tax=Trueperella pyogenes TaxID=1661 RepID=UPI0009B8DD9B|nr:recombinase family protein [Trueperella pyogenes]AWA43948.1 hypothetical protein DBV13_08005 [Trueperella pyogenes]
MEDPVHKPFDTLTQEGLETATGKKTWSASQVRGVLTNEKYKGDALLQKNYTVDFLTKKQVKNQGEIPQYYVTGNHEAIISPAVWDFVQAELSAIRKRKRSASRQRTFSGKIRCGQCGHWYGSKTWHAGTKYEKHIWRCNNKYDANTKCETPNLTDQQIKTAFIDAVHQLIADQTQADELLDAAIMEELDTTDLRIEADQIFARVNAASEALNKLIAHNAKVAQDQNVYQRRYDKLAAEHTQLLAEYEEIISRISDLKDQQSGYQHYKTKIEKLDPAELEFTPYLWHTLVDHATVNEHGVIAFAFRDGNEHATQPR